ncbi:MAG: hypothetical protein IJM15_09500 [Erysipelotrichaceae bacterium]|nr:hypothetical protein [Erysipelotrichaceae bacterium]
MLKGIISIIANKAYILILYLPFYTDRAHMPDGKIREWKRSPVDRLAMADENWLFSLQLVLSAVSIITSLLTVLGIKSNIIKAVQLISLIASTVMFVIILIVTNNIHAKY